MPERSVPYWNPNPMSTSQFDPIGSPYRVTGRDPATAVNEDWDGSWSVQERIDEDRQSRRDGILTVISP